jgi:hypothetical protein
MAEPTRQEQREAARDLARDEIRRTHPEIPTPVLNEADARLGLPPTDR